jgi:hypothetical protein
MSQSESKAEAQAREEWLHPRKRKHTQGIETTTQSEKKTVVKQGKHHGVAYSITLVERGRKTFIRYPKNIPQAKDIKRWIRIGLSAGYMTYLLKFGEDPHCSACRDAGCENRGHGDDACEGFKYGDRW